MEHEPVLVQLWEHKQFYMLLLLKPLKNYQEMEFTKFQITQINEKIRILEKKLKNETNI